jgi:hypothetical protein
MPSLEEFCGDEWLSIRKDAKKLAAAAALRSADWAIKHGKIPYGYTKTVECANCGKVKLWPECPEKVLGCPWCHVDVKPEIDDE